MNAARGVALMVVPQKIRSEGFQWEVTALDGMKRTNAAEKWSIRLLQADLSQSNSAFERRLSSTAVRQVFAVQLSPRAAHSSKSLLVRLNIARG